MTALSPSVWLPNHKGPAAPTRTTSGTGGAGGGNTFGLNINPAIRSKKSSKDFLA